MNPTNAAAQMAFLSRPSFCMLSITHLWAAVQHPAPPHNRLRPEEYGVLMTPPVIKVTLLS